MSITFHVEISEHHPEPQKKVYCEERYPGLEAAYFEGSPGVLWDEHGPYELAGTWPQANFSEANRRVYLDLLGLSDEPVGFIPHGELAQVKRRAIAALNSRRLADYERAPEHQPAVRGRRLTAHHQGAAVDYTREGSPALWSGGLSAERVAGGLRTLLAVFDKAQGLGLGVTYA